MNHMDYLIKSDGEVLGFSLKNQYIDFLKSNSYYETTIYDIGDGVGISVRKDI